MGFKKITSTDLKKKAGFNLIGMPQTQKNYTETLNSVDNEKEKVIGPVTQTSNVVIVNEEFLEFEYDYDGVQKIFNGYGNLTLINNSSKDRVWDTRLNYKASQYSTLEQEGELFIGIMEPKSNKTMRYDLVSPVDNLEFLEVSEETEVLNEELKSIQNETETTSRKNILLLGKENVIEFSITIENTSNVTFENIEFRKALFKDFYDFQISDNTSKQVSIQRNSMIWNINELLPSHTANLSFSIKVLPLKGQKIRTGNNTVKFQVKDNLISQLKIIEFSAFSHAFHAIEKKEINDKPNHWLCRLIFENHSEFPIKIKKISVSQDTQIYLDLDDIAAINPGESFNSREWELEDKKEPGFLRKLDYSVNYEFQQRATIISTYNDDKFETLDFLIEKSIPQSEIKSFEESLLNNKVMIKNRSTVPIQGLVIKEVIPEDFIMPTAKEDYSLHNEAGLIPNENYMIQIEPDNVEPSQKHVLKVIVNNEQYKDIHAIELGGFLELK